MSPRQFQPKSVVPKIHTKKRKWRQTVEIIIVAVVVVGSLFTFFQFNDISVDQAISKLREAFKIQREIPTINTEASVEERIKAVFEDKMLKITSIDDSNDKFVTIKSKEKVTVVISTLKDMEEQAQTLQNVLTKAKIESKSVSLVDFRFDKLVVRYNR